MILLQHWLSLGVLLLVGYVVLPWIEGSSGQQCRNLKSLVKASLVWMCNVHVHSYWICNWPCVLELASVISNDIIATWTRCISVI